ncbi:MAG: alcohol dehydrogenase catalytic domain-containing protein [Patescibacteria group bacterium]
MKALIYAKPKTLVYTDLSKPKITDNEILIKIKSVGICGTDLHIYNGGMDLPTPLIMGHEFSGVVEQIGKKVNGFKSGDRVVGEHVIPCRRCYYCLKGKPNLCPQAKIIGLHRPGALAEYLAIPADLVYKIPPKISFEEAALIEPLTIALYAVEKAGQLLDKNVAVIGQGPIGLLLDQTLKSVGANIVGLDVQGHRLKFAKKKKWVDAVINSGQHNIVKQIENFAPGGVDMTFEAVGKEVTAQIALDITARDGHIFLLGVFENPSRLDLMKIIKKELNVHGSWTCAFSFPEAIDLVAKNKINLKNLITHRYAFEDGVKAFRDAAGYSGKRIKTVINF